MCPIHVSISVYICLYMCLIMCIYPLLICTHIIQFISLTLLIYLICLHNLVLSPYNNDNNTYNVPLMGHRVTFLYFPHDVKLSDSLIDNSICNFAICTYIICNYT